MTTAADRLFMESVLAMFDDLIRGLASQEGEAWDNAFVPDVKDHLFEGRPGTGGLDLVALNIQRGRDHGLAGMKVNLFR